MQPPQALREGDGEHQGRSEKEMGKGSSEESRIANYFDSEARVRYRTAKPFASY